VEDLGVVPYFLTPIWADGIFFSAEVFLRS